MNRDLIPSLALPEPGPGRDEHFEPWRPKTPYLSGNHAPNSYDQSNVEETQYNGNMVKNHMKTTMGNNVPQSQSIF